jgi:hypothetical protein
MASTVPAISWPKTMGVLATGSWPRNMWRSEPQTPAASTRTRASPGLGVGTGTSSMSRGEPGACSRAAIIARDRDPPERATLDPLYRLTLIKLTIVYLARMR